VQQIGSLSGVTRKWSDVVCRPPLLRDLIEISPCGHKLVRLHAPLAVSSHPIASHEPSIFEHVQMFRGRLTRDARILFELYCGEWAFRHPRTPFMSTEERNWGGTGVQQMPGCRRRCYPRACERKDSHQLTRTSPTYIEHRTVGNCPKSAANRCYTPGHQHCHLVADGEQSR
jgi:hypothetical protein